MVEKISKDTEQTTLRLKHEESEIEKISQTLGDVEPTEGKNDGKKAESLMNVREKLVRDKDSISNDISKLSQEELRAHNIIKYNNERM